MTIPLATLEVRWFFEGPADDHAGLKSWFETSAPIPKTAGLGAPEWRGRLGDRPDIYLVIPGAEDIGIKWREGEFQVKGRVATVGTRLFAGNHQGKVERWMKWAYAKMPAGYRQIFADGSGKGLLTTSVHKMRAQRKVRLDTMKGTAEEVDPRVAVDRGLGLELTNLEIAGVPYCSVAVEAFPDDSGMDASLTDVIDAFLGELQGVQLSAANSWSYPAWLTRLP